LQYAIRGGPTWRQCCALVDQFPGRSTIPLIKLGKFLNLQLQAELPLG